MKVGLPGEPGIDLVIAFDDGEINIYQHAYPLLKKYSMKALVFIIADYIGKSNSWDLNIGYKTSHLGWREIREMRDFGIEFGSHGLTHQNLTRLSPDDLALELHGSKRMIEDQLGRCRCISYPFNRVNRRVIRVAADAGYDYGFGGDGSNKMLIKKEAVYITDNNIAFKIKLDERSPFYRYERMKQRIINMFTLATMLYRPGRRN